MFILSMGRKNAKTVFAALLLLLHLVGPEARRNSQLFSDAQSREQASILFAYAAKIVRMSPDLDMYITIRDATKQLFCPELGTLYRALSAEASTAYGFNPAFAVHDETGQVIGPRSALFEALETAAGAQEEPLSVVISTQAANDGDLLSMLIDDALTGKDPRVKVELYTASLDLDPFSEKAIRAANPHYDVFMNKEEVRAQAESARRMPSRESAFRNLVLNQRVQATNPYVARSVWDACSGEVDLSLFEGGHKVYAALDLSARNDLTCKLKIAEDDSGCWHVAVMFYAPKEGLKDRVHRDRAPYDLWAQDGYLTLTPGSSVEYAVVARDLVEDCDAGQMAEIAFDPWRMDVLKSELSRRGVELPLVEFGQGFKSMAPALDALDELLLAKKIRHGGNPILRWCAFNAVAVRDPAGNRKLDKSKATGRIDGIVTLAMAVGRAVSRMKPETSIYLQRDLIVL